MRLTERDIELLKLLNRFDAINIEGLKMLYGKRYFRDRRDLLKKNNYINSHYGIATIGIQGRNKLQELNIDISNSKISQRDFLSRCANVCTLSMKLSNWKFSHSREVKKNYNLNRGLRFIAMIEKNKKKYLIYHIPSKIRIQTLKLVQTEISGLGTFGFDNVICLIENGNKEIMQKFLKTSIDVKELILLSTKEEDISFLNTINKVKSKEWALKIMLGENIPISNPMANVFDYAIDTIQIVDLIMLDVAKILHVQSYLNILMGTPHLPNIAIICLEKNKDCIRALFPDTRIKIKTIPQIALKKAIKNNYLV